MTPSAEALRGARIRDLEAAQELALQRTDTAPAESIAISLATLPGTTVEDLRKDYDRDRRRREAFANELRRLVGPEGAALAPQERNRRLRVLAHWLDGGYDGPPDEDVYAEGFEPPC
jgi:hypothetical protein